MKRRTNDDTLELAQRYFRENVQAHLTAEEIDEFAQYGAVGCGSPFDFWEAVVGRPVTAREFTQYKVFKPSDTCPYVERIYAWLLVSRYWDEQPCYALWKPVLEPYTGPWFPERGRRKLPVCPQVHLPVSRCQV
ncbi:DUF440 family protein [Massilia sp. CCM 8734]|uniref:DUF440 family protein n=1 Tax=Massilia sp. CCM 8734 TaxID=2609283 RepID=UPI001E47C496|nr:DUF440 family protein [Massilia sp. CCM 8734]